MKKIVLTSICCYWLTGFAQVINFLPQERIIVPGSYGTENKVLASYQSFWAGHQGNKFSHFYGGFDYLYKNKLATGMMIQSENLSLYQSKTAKFGIAIPIKLNTNTSLSLGTAPSISVFSFGEQKYHLEHTNDPIFQNLGSRVIDAGLDLGLSLNNRKYYIDLACLHAVGSDVKNPGTKLNIPRTYVFNLGHKGFGLDTLKLEPSIWLNTIDFITYQGKIDTKVSYANRVWIGGGILVSYFKNPNIGYCTFFGARTLNYFSFQLGYNFGNKALYRYSQGVFEIKIAYDLIRSSSRKISVRSGGDS